MDLILLLIPFAIGGASHNARELVKESQLADEPHRPAGVEPDRSSGGVFW